MRNIRRWLLTKERSLIETLLNRLVKITHKLRMSSMATYRKINLTYTAEERLAKYEKNMEAIRANAPSAAAFDGIRDEEGWD